ncbi:MAG TPA: NADH-quinone oxidoreductase subunit J [Candidatus Binataceae bacterium]|jgi:NADH-quinone oxidoreductase subunit J
MPLWLFAFLASLALISALGVILQRNPIHSLLALIMTLLVIGVLFIGEGAATVGFLQIIVYAGAIMVLFLFVIWLLNLQSQNLDPGRVALKFFAGIGSAGLAAILFALLIHSATTVKPIPVTAEYGSIDTLAETLFSDYLIAFEVTSILLLAAVVGSIALARRIPGSGLKAASAAEGRPEGDSKLVSGATR